MSEDRHFDRWLAGENPGYLETFPLLKYLVGRLAELEERVMALEPGNR